MTAAEAIPVSEQLTTKTDLAGVKAELAKVRADLKAEIGEVRTHVERLKPRYGGQASPLLPLPSCSTGFSTG